MSLRLGLAAIAALCALWCIYRDWRRDQQSEVLPPPSKACDRNTVEAVP